MHLLAGQALIAINTHLVSSSRVLDGLAGAGASGAVPVQATEQAVRLWAAGAAAAREGNIDIDIDLDVDLVLEALQVRRSEQVQDRPGSQLGPATAGKWKSSECNCKGSCGSRQVTLFACRIERCRLQNASVPVIRPCRPDGVCARTRTPSTWHRSAWLRADDCCTINRCGSICSRAFAPEARPEITYAEQRTSQAQSPHLQVAHLLEVDTFAWARLLWAAWLPDDSLDSGALPPPCPAVQALLVGAHETLVDAVFRAHPVVTDADLPLAAKLAHLPHAADAVALRGCLRPSGAEPCLALRPQAAELRARIAMAAAQVPELRTVSLQIRGDHAGDLRSELAAAADLLRQLSAVRAIAVLDVSIDDHIEHNDAEARRQDVCEHVSRLLAQAPTSRHVCLPQLCIASEARAAAC